MISVILFEMSKHSDFHLIFFQIEGAGQDFTVVTKLIKNFKSLYGFGGRFLKIRDVCMDFELYFKVHNLVSVHPKSIILGQMTNLNMIFHVVLRQVQKSDRINSDRQSGSDQLGSTRIDSDRLESRKKHKIKLNIETITHF